jgi:8-oxo-dGTP diphosphatase
MANAGSGDSSKLDSVRGSEVGPGKLIEVSAGLVFRNGLLLITQRRAQDHLGGLWEFPGGKRHLNETFEDCLRRELREELGIEVEVKGLIETITHEYPEKAVHLQFFKCVWQRHEPQALGCQDFVWVGKGQLDSYAFPAADKRLLEKLVNTPELWR